MHKETKAVLKSVLVSKALDTLVEPRNSGRALQSCAEKERDKDRDKDITEVEGRGSGLFYLHWLSDKKGISLLWH